MKYLLLCMLFFYTNVNAQLSKQQQKEMDDNTKKIQQSVEQSKQGLDETNRVLDSLRIEHDNKQNIHNVEFFMAEQKIQQDKNLKLSYFRIGIGVLMFVVLGIGLARKKKQTL
jgi:uncharacterized protein YuzE